MRFEWGPEKAARNERIHGVSFEEACEVFTTEAPVLEVYDVDLVVWTERADDLVRVISAWWATKAEEQLYVEYVENLR